MSRQRPAANPYPQQPQQQTAYIPNAQKPASRPDEKIPNEQEYNLKFTSRQFHENDFVMPVCDREITPDEMLLIRRAWAKSYNVNEKCIDIRFKPLNQKYYDINKEGDRYLLENYLRFCIYIMGDYEEDKSNSFKVDISKLRLCYTMLVPITERAKEEVRRRKMATITSGTPLQTIHISKPAEITAIAPRGRLGAKKVERIAQ